MRDRSEQTLTTKLHLAPDENGGSGILKVVVIVVLIVVVVIW